MVALQRGSTTIVYWPIQLLMMCDEIRQKLRAIPTLMKETCHEQNHPYQWPFCLYQSLQVGLFPISRRFPEIHQIVKKVKRGVCHDLSFHISYLISILVPASLSSDLLILETMAKRQGRLKTRIVRIFCIFLKGCRRLVVGSGVPG